MLQALLYLWDFLLLTLVCFPLLTGGIWYSSNGMILELSEPIAPVLVTFFFGFIFKLRLKVPIETSPLSRFFISAWVSWKRKLSLRPLSTLLDAFFLVGCFWAFASIQLLKRFVTGGDLAIPLNAIWNLSHGYGYVASMKNGKHFLLDHQDPLFMLVAPLFKLFPYAETLLIVQAFMLASGGIAVFYLAEKYFRSEETTVHWVPAFAPLMYWMSRLVRKPNLFDFHQGIFLLPLFLFGLAGIFSEKKTARALGVLAFLLALLAKETAGPIAIGIAIALLLGAAPKRTLFVTSFSLFLIPVGIFVLYCATHLTPQLLGGNYGYTGLYPQFGKGISSVLFAPFLQPKLFFSTLLASDRRAYLYLTLLPFVFLPLASKAFVAALPAYLMLFLTEGTARVNLYAHYTVEPAVGLFWSTLSGIKNVLSFAQVRNHEKWLKILLLVFTLAYSGRSEWVNIRQAPDTPHKQWLRTEFLPALDPTVSIETTGKLVSHVANRHWVNSLSEFKAENGKPMDCVILDTEVAGESIENPARDFFLQHFQELQYEEIYQCAGLRLFQHKKASTSCLTRPLGCFH